jgi:hypothetical protein
MPSWFTGDLGSLAGAVIVGGVILVYTTITGFGGYFLRGSISFALKHEWRRAGLRGLYSLVVTAGVLALTIILASGSTPWLEWAILPIPYILGFFGQFIVPGDWG